MNRSLRVLDGAVFIIEGVAGVQPQSETNWRLADRYHVPRIIYINKLDRTGADFYRAAATLSEKLGITWLALQLPIGIEDSLKGVVDLVEMKGIIWEGDELGAKFHDAPIPDDLKEKAAEYRQILLDTALSVDDAAMEEYFDKGDVSVETLKRCIKKGTIAGTFRPVLCGSSFKNKGVQPLLDAVIDYLPSPVDIPGIKVALDEGQDEADHPERRVIKADEKAPFAGLAFKIINDKYGTDATRPSGDALHLRVGEALDHDAVAAGQAEIGQGGVHMADLARLLRRGGRRGGRHGGEQGGEAAEGEGGRDAAHGMVLLDRIGRESARAVPGGAPGRFPAGAPGRGGEAQSPSATPSRRGSAPPSRRPCGVTAIACRPEGMARGSTRCPRAARAGASSVAGVPASSSTAPPSVPTCGSATAACGPIPQSSNATSACAT